MEAVTVSFQCPAEQQAALILDLVHRKSTIAPSLARGPRFVPISERAAVYLFRPLSRAEREAWRRWHRDMDTSEVLRLRAAGGVFPLIRGGTA